MIFRTETDRNSYAHYFPPLFLVIRKTDAYSEVSHLWHKAIQFLIYIHLLNNNINIWKSASFWNISTSMFTGIVLRCHGYLDVLCLVGSRVPSHMIVMRFGISFSYPVNFIFHLVFCFNHEMTLLTTDFPCGISLLDWTEYHEVLVLLLIADSSNLWTTVKHSISKEIFWSSAQAAISCRSGFFLRWAEGTNCVISCRFQISLSNYTRLPISWVWSLNIGLIYAWANA